MILKYTIALVFFLFYFSNASSQPLLNIGDWQNHLNYRECFHVTQSPDDVIISTGNSLIFLDKKELAKIYFGKKDGLSETKIKLVKYDANNKQLIVIYESGAIDVVGEDKIEYITAIKNNANIAGSKTVNDVHISDESTCYFATAFGVIEFDLKKLEFRSTTFTGVPVSAISSDEENIYAAMDDGLYKIQKSNFNKENFQNWEVMTQAFGLPALYKSTNVEVFKNKVYVVVDDELYVKSDNQKFSRQNLNKGNFKIEWLSAEGKNLIVGIKDNLYSSSTRFIDEDGNVQVGSADCINRTIYGIEDQYGKIWYADQWRQIRYTNGINEGCNRLEFDSPYANTATHIEVGPDNNVFFASGGATENYQIDFIRSGFYILNKDQSWSNFNEEYNAPIREKDFLSLFTIAPHPKNKDLVYVGSYLKGIMEYNIATKAFRFFSENTNNGQIKSSLQSIVGAPGQVRVAHMKFDKNDNLWASNFGAPKPISVFTREGNWHSFSVPGNTLLSKMAIDFNDNKWFATVGSGPSVVVFNDNNTPADPTDDKTKSINSSNSILSSQVNCVEVDLNGDVWVGTSKGPVIFECDPFSNDCIGSQRKVLQDSIPALLLETEEIFAIEMDGANRKWFGTRNGIFVQSSNGDEQVLRLTEENSPLLNNKIIDLDFDGVSGLMYISTESGFQSYKTNSTAAGKQNDENAYAFPNPVRPDYTGPIAIKGLARDADIRITDVSGKLVFKSKANGGQAIWDGNDYASGSRVDTGVYLVFSASEQDPTVKDVVVTKILVVK
jgi:hypothetical protein